jgi:hypothetical protein
MALRSLSFGLIKHHLKHGEIRINTAIEYSIAVLIVETYGVLCFNKSLH